MTLRLAILKALDNVSPYLLPETALWIDVNLLLAQPVTLTELRHKMESLEAARLVIGLRDAEARFKWRITDNGKAELMAS